MELADDLKNEELLSASQALTVTPADEEAGGGAGGAAGLTDWQIALSVVLPVLLIACLAALLLGLWHHRRRKNTKSTAGNTENTEYTENIDSRYQEKPLPYTDIDFGAPEPSDNSVVIVTEETDSEEDEVRVFAEEGDKDTLASLSSLVTQSDAQSIGELTAGLGDKFHGLAKIYKEVDEDSEPDITIYVGTVPHNLGHESWV